MKNDKELKKSKGSRIAHNNLYRKSFRVAIALRATARIKEIITNNLKIGATPLKIPHRF